MKLRELLKNEINEYEKNIALISGRIREIKDLYDIIKPKGKRIAIENSVLLTEKKLFDKLINTIKKNNYIVIERMIQNKIEYHRYLKETTEQLGNLGLSREKIYSDAFISNAKRILPKDEYDAFLSIKEMDEKLKQLDNDIVWYIYDMIIEMYEKLTEEKENKKDKKKKLEYAYKAIKRNEKLLPREIATITNLINDNSDEEKDANILLLELNEYIAKTNIKKEVEIKEDKKSKPILYTDKDIEVANEKVEEDNSLYVNYLEFIRSFNSFDELNKFLDTFGNIELVKRIIFKVLNLLSEDNEDVLLRDYLTLYVSNLNSEDSIEENTKEEITILYYGFLDGKNRILNDIEKNIPEEYYSDVIKGINMISIDGAKSKRENFVDIKKVYKVRVNDIRISFKRLENNVYVILGIFCKKDNKGYDIVRTSKRRNYNFSLSEDSIVKAHNIDNLWNDYIEKNNELKTQIDKVLKNKRKVM